MNSRGFTLMELLVVLAIVASVSVMLPWAISRASPGVELRTTAREVAAALRAARNHAITKNRETRFMIDVGAGTYRADGADIVRRIPSAFAISMLAAAPERVDTARVGIRFFPDGASTGGRVRLEVDGRKRDVVVDWVTGRVAVSE